MDREDIIRMAREAGLFHFYDSEGQCTGITNARLVTEDKERDDDRLVEMLAPFAHLVYEATFRDANIAASRTILDAAVLEEREACAKVCDLMEQQAEGTECCKWPTPIDCAAAIRARSNP